MNRGMTLLEVLIAITILSIVVLGLGSSFFALSDYRELTTDRIAASNALRSQAEMITAYKDLNGFDNLVTYLNSGSADLNFTVEELSDSAGQVNVYLNENQVPTEFGADPVTFTNANGETFGRLDLDSDDVDTEDLSGSGNVNMAPVEIVLTWNDSRGSPLRERFFVMIADID